MGLGVDHLAFAGGDGGGDGAGGEVAGVDVDVLHGLLDDGGLVVLVVDDEVAV